MYKSKYGITDIIDKHYDNLSISWDTDFEEGVKYPVLLFTPSMEDTSNHYHISISRSEASILRDWLNEYLEDTK